MSKLLKFMFLCLIVYNLTSCRMVTRDYDKPDVKEINTSKGIAFDIRIIKDIYGIPPIVDINKNTIGYYNIYCTYDGILFVEPSKSEIWYLLLQPTKDDNYYMGKRHIASFNVTEGKNPSFTHGQPKLKIDEIVKYEEVSNDPFFEKILKSKNENKPKKPNSSNVKLKANIA
jgi:hypothetical protein